MITIRTGSHKQQKQQGLTLIELMVSMLIGLFIITAVTQIFLSSNESNNLNRQLGLMQEAARIALTEIATDIRMAGYTGCISSVEIGNALADNATDFEWLTAEQKIQGLSLADTQSKLDAGALTEGLIIFRLSPDISYPVTNHNTSSNTITLDTNVSGLLTTGQPLGAVRQDCSQIALISPSQVNGNDITHATGGSGNFRNCVSQLQGSFRCYDSSVPTGALSFNPGYIKPVDSVSYFIRLEDSLPTLFRKDVSNGTGTALVDGIENMRIYYGIDTDNNGTPDQFVNAGWRAYRHSDWQQVTAIRVHLLVRSETSEVPADLAPKDYFFDGSRVTPPDISAGVPDGFLRKEYVMTMALRNQG